LLAALAEAGLEYIVVAGAAAVLSEVELGLVR
jgi:hypothetical protein